MARTTLVTGAVGFIGSYVVEALTAQGRNVIAFDRRACPGIETILGDVRDPAAVTDAMAHADSWIHLAGVLGTQETIANPLPAAETNILGGLNVLQAAAQYELPGVNIAVGNWWENNTYSISKSTSERFAAMYRTYRNLPVTVVRALNAYGPRQTVAAPFGPSKVRKIMPSFICRALTGAPIEVYGDGQQIMDMIHVRDVADILVRALTHTETYGGIDAVLEAGTGRRTSVLDIAQTVIKEAGSGQITHLPMRPGETAGAVVLGSPATLDLLSPQPLTPFEDGVAETVAWYREHWLPGWQA
ncbi:NAD-dependent epimerase/dehydratase family protein [Streptomyces sp. enrichment culture]|uniref:NAD-dependent epimerase/dehydratase family protein n=1 Tax=Streptomyces sp. enrichment culture TaxID=1795815 RepID=UPI003F575514